MLNQKYEQRLVQWRDLRSKVENENNPIKLCLDFCNNLQPDRLWLDPYDSSQWPKPWELIHENVFCNLSKLLFFCYTFQLTDRFSHCSFEIHIGISKKQSAHHFVLFIDNQAIGYYNNEMCVLDNLEDLETELCVTMPDIH
jgi:hypothetical protein